MTNMDAKKKALYARNESARANELNDFYMCFEVDSVSECCAVLENLGCNEVYRIMFDPHSVNRLFESMNVKKVEGPDNLSAFFLKTFAD